MYSEYNSRRVRIQLKADEVSGFNIYVKVILIEDADDLSAITQNITLTSGYVQPSTVPVTTPSPDNGVPYATIGSTTYQFIQRNAPVVTEQQAWTPVDATDGEQLTDWVDGSTNWTYSGSGSIYNKNP